MFRSTITISKPTSTVTSFEGFSTVYAEIIGAEAEQELNYIRSDQILDGKMREEAYKNWDNDTKTATIEYYHNTSQGMKDYQVELTTNKMGILVTQKLQESGWTIDVDAGSADSTAKANKLHVIDEWAIGDVRPERRQEILDKISAEKG